MICEAISLTGSVFAVPTLMAKLNVNLGTNLKECVRRTLEGVKSRTHNDELDLKQGEQFYDELFKPEFWQPEWKGSLENFVTYAFIISFGFYQDDPDQFNNAGNFLMKEFKLDSPYDSFEALKACQEDPDKLKADLLSMTDNTSADIASMDALNNQPFIDTECEFEETLASMRNDYLLNRLNKVDKFDFYLYLLNQAGRLNKPANVNE